MQANHLNEQLHHITKVMRMNINDKIEAVFNSKCYLLNITSLSPFSFEIIETSTSNSELNVDITIGRQLPIIDSKFVYNGKEGHEIVFNDIKENDIFGNNLIFSSYPFYKGNLIAKKDSLIAFINESLLIELLSSNNLFLKAYLRLQSDNAKSLNDKIKLLSFKNIEERFIYYLYLNNNDITFSSITNLASLLNIERETLSRLISKLVNKKLISKENNHIRLL